MASMAAPTVTWTHPGGKLLDLGSDALTQDDLLAIIIGTGVPGKSAVALAKDVLDQFGGLYQILRLGTVENLSRISGLGPRKACRILAALELGRRLFEYDKLMPKIKPYEAMTGLFPVPTGPPPTPADIARDAELLAEIIGSGVKGRTSVDIAKDLLKRFGSFTGLFGKDLGLYEKVRGLDSVKIIRIVAALEIAKRIAHALS